MKHLRPKKIVLIGASTGGPGQIHKIIKSLPKLQNTSVIIAQHMADGFLESFVHSLLGSSVNYVKLVEDSLVFERNMIFVCEKNISLVQTENNLIFKADIVLKNSFNPDINNIFNSFVPLCSEIEILSVILTGIGDDGINSCVNLQKNGAICITETSKSAIIDGMPSRARESVPGIKAYDMEEIPKIISEFCK